MIIDPASSFAQAKIITADREFLLWPGAEARSDSAAIEPPNDDVIPLVTSISMEVGMGMSGKVSVSVFAPYEVGLHLLEGDILRIGNIVAVQFSYPSVGVTIPWFEGVTSKPDFSLGADGFTATINGEGMAFAAMRSEGSETWVNQSYADVIEAVAARSTNGWNVNFPRRVDEEDPLFREREQVTQSGRSDWSFVSMLARAAGCDPVFGYSGRAVDEMELRLVRRAEALARPPTYSFVMRGQVDWETRFPLLSASSSGEGAWLPAGNARVRYADIDVVTGDRVEGEVTREDSADEEPPLGGGGVEAGGASQPAGANRIAAVLGVDGTRVVAPAAGTGRSPDEVAREEVSDARFIGGILMDVETYGLPGVWPEDIVRVEGVGRFSGNYQIKSIRHEWSGTWTMAMALLSNVQGDADAVSELVSQPYATFNDEQAEGGTSDEVAMDAEEI